MQDYAHQSWMDVKQSQQYRGPANHKGIDYPVNGNITSPVAGKVWAIGYADSAGHGGTYCGDYNMGYQYGNSVLVKDASGHYHFFPHMSSIAVTQGQMVTTGQVLGHSGRTGSTQVTGVHIHWAVYTKPGPSISLTVDPRAYLAARIAADITPNQTIDDIARAVINGRYGNGEARRKALTAAGYDAAAVQARVNQLLAGTATARTIAQLATEVIQGKWGNGAARKSALTAAGYDAAAVQAEVNRRL